MQDEILTDLAKIADLKVISRTSVMRSKDAAKHNVREMGDNLAWPMCWKAVCSALPIACASPPS